MENSAWIRFHVYTSLKRKTMLVISSHAPNIMAQIEVHAPKLHCIQQSGWNEGSLSRSMKDSTCILRDLNQKTRFGTGVVSFFNEVDTIKELSL